MYRVSIPADMMAFEMAFRRFSHAVFLDTTRPKKRKTGKAYPHSSTRQRDRYARQIAAGKLNMNGI